MTMFGDDAPAPTPPPLPPPPPAAPQFAMGMGKYRQQGKPFGGTLLTSPIAPAPAAQTAKPTLVTS